MSLFIMDAELTLHPTGIST